MNLQNELNLAIELAYKVSDVIIKIYNADDFQTEFKEDDTPVTKADKAANEIIVAGIKANFPAHAILSEESADDLSRLKNPWCWIIDPVDGTKHFIKKSDEFSVNIALSYENKAVMGVVYIPVTGEMFYGSKGSGAYYKKNRDENPIKISVSKKTKKLRALASNITAIEELREKMAKEGVISVTPMGSALKGCLIAKGEAELYYRRGYTSEWDTAAQQCIVEEAGGYLMQLDHTPMLYNRENTLNEKGFYIINNKGNIMRNLKWNK